MWLTRPESVVCCGKPPWAGATTCRSTLPWIPAPVWVGATCTVLGVIERVAAGIIVEGSGVIRRGLARDVRYLLQHVRQLMSEQMTTVAALRRKGARGKGDVVAPSVGAGTNGMGRSGSPGIGVQAHRAEVSPEARLKIGALLRIERRLTGTHGAHGGGRSARRYGSLLSTGFALHLVFLFRRARRAFALHAGWRGTADSSSRQAGCDPVGHRIGFVLQRIVDRTHLRLHLHLRCTRGIPLFQNPQRCPIADRALKK
jgi:hypothetical protein